MAIIDIGGTREMREALKTARCSVCGRPFDGRLQKFFAVEQGRYVKGRLVVTYRHAECRPRNHAEVEGSVRSGGN